MWTQSTYDDFFEIIVATTLTLLHFSNKMKKREKNQIDKISTIIDHQTKNKHTKCQNDVQTNKTREKERENWINKNFYKESFHAHGNTEFFFWFAIQYQNIKTEYLF